MQITKSMTSVKLKEMKYERNIKSRKLIEKTVFFLFWLSAFIAVSALLVIIGYVLINGLKAVNLEFLTTRPAGGVSGEGGMSTTIVTTIYLVVLTITIASPLGVLAAIFMVEYAHEIEIGKGIIPGIIKLARIGVEILVGVPSIVFGLFGYIFFVTMLRLNFSLLSAGLSGACLILPVIIRTSEEAILTVPQSYREGSLALGTTKWQTVSSVVLPAAIPGIVTGIILSIGRIIAETAIFWVTLGGSYRLPANLLSSGRTMALHVYSLASETRAFDKALGTSAVLIFVIVIINLSVNLTSSYFSRKFSGK
jgi:phosphate transport system permease protein